MRLEIFGDNLTLLLKRKKITRSALAEHLGISPTAVGKYTKGEGFPEVLTLLRICEFVICSPNELLLNKEDRISLVNEDQAPYGKLVECIEVDGEKYTRDDIMKLEAKFEAVQEVVRASK